MNSVNTVENASPPITAAPIGTLLSAPAPKAKAMGRIPKIVDKLVIKIGINRATAAPKIACSASIHPLFFTLIGKFNN